MSALTLPPPVNHANGGDNVLAASGSPANGHANGSGTPSGIANGSGKKSAELLQGVIYPPREIRAIIDKTAVAVCKSPAPQLLEEKIADRQKADPKFSFLKDGDAFNRYYRYMIERVKEDGEQAIQASQANAAAANAGAPSAGGATPGSAAPLAIQMGKKEEKPIEEPPAFEFLVDVPHVTALDLDILRLTALFVARRGRPFLQSLSVKEGRNFQFDFLRPTHSLFGYFNRMVDSYSKILNPPTELMQSLEAAKEEGHKWKDLEAARARGEWLRSRRENDRKREAEREADMKAFQEIDWQDFVVVQTIEFTSTDTTIDLPPPTTVREMEKLTLNERKMAALIVEEAGQEADEARAANGAANGAGGADGGDMEVEMDEESDDEETKERKRKEQEEVERARAVQAKAMGQAGMKIRKDYVPKGLAGRQSSKVPMTICPYCKQSIPETEISEHIRIELLDPKWKEQKQLMDQKRTQAAQLMQGADVSASLKQLASARTDLFGTAEDEEKRKKEEEAERAARKAKETIIWDGHTASKESTLDTFKNKYSLEDQINAIHNRHSLLPGKEGLVGPQLGVPVAPTLAAGASTPGGGTAFTGATISAGPQGPSAPQPFPPQFGAYGQPGGFQPMPGQPPFDPSMFGMQGQAAAAGGIHPSRLAAMGGSPAMPPQAGYMASPYGGVGQVRPHDGDGEEQQQPPRKRQRVPKLPGGHLYAEHDWNAMHPEPINLSIQLPNMPDKPEWKLNGSIITVEDIPVNFLVSTLRERIKNIVDSPLPMSRIKLDYGSKTLSNASTLASMNLGEGDIVNMSIRK